MSNEQIIQKLDEMRRHYDEGWTMHDLQNDLEEIFYELVKRESGLEVRPEGSKNG